GRGTCKPLKVAMHWHRLLLDDTPPLASTRADDSSLISSMLRQMRKTLLLWHLCRCDASQPSSSHPSVTFVRQSCEPTPPRPLLKSGDSASAFARCNARAARCVSMPILSLSQSIAAAAPLTVPSCTAMKRWPSE